MPTQVTYPGVYVEEIPSGVRSIEGVSTSICAFVGSARKGAFNKAVRVQSFTEFTRKFGGLQSGSELGHAVRQFFLNGGTDAWVVRVPRDATLAKMKRALRSFDAVDLVNLVVLPGIADPKVVAAAAEYCKERRAFLIADSPASAKTPADMLKLVGTPALPKTSYAAIYYPWLTIRDPLTKKLRVIPPSGTIAGMFARIDSLLGVWNPPAGKGATLNGVDGLEYNLTDAENGVLNPRAINCLRMFVPSGPLAWGARTLEGDDLFASEWKYIPIRRLALFIEESIDRGTQWAVFEPNDEPLWAQLRLTIGAFLHRLFAQGAFTGQTPRDSYFVKCDRDTTMQNDIDHGNINVLVGFAPLKPAEFVIIKIQLKGHARE